MKPSELLKHCENIISTYPKPVGYEEIKLLIARVKKLEEALEFYANGWVEMHSHLDKNNYIKPVWRCKAIDTDHGQKARKALSEDE